MKPGEIFHVPLGQKKSGKEGSKDISTVFDTSPFLFFLNKKFGDIRWPILYIYSVPNT